MPETSSYYLEISKSMATVWPLFRCQILQMVRVNLCKEYIKHYDVSKPSKSWSDGIVSKCLRAVALSARNDRLVFWSCPKYCTLTRAWHLSRKHLAYCQPSPPFATFHMKEIYVVVLYRQRNLLDLYRKGHFGREESNLLVKR